MAKEFLTRKGIHYIEKNVASDPVAANEMLQRSGQRGVPVIAIDGQIVVGFDQAKLERLLTAASHPSLGVKVADASRFAQRVPNIPSSGAYVGGVSPSSPAAVAGIKEGDVIVELADQPVRSADDLERITSGLTPGTRVSVSLMRGGQITSTVVSI